MAHKKEHATMKKHTLHSEKTTHVRKRFMRKRHAITAVIFSAIIAVAGVSLELAHAATGSNSIYFNPSQATYTVGQQFTVGVYETSSGGVYAAQASFTYPQSQLQLNSVSACTVGSFTIDPQQSTGGAGHVLIDCAAKAAVTGSALIANVTFTALAAGSPTLTPNAVCSGASTSLCNSVTDINSTNQLSSVTPSTYTVQAPVTPTCPSGDTGIYPACVAPSTGGGGGGGSGSSSPPSSGGSSSGSSSSGGGSSATAGSQSITPSTSTTPITAPSGSQVQISTPATIQPATIQTDAVSKIQYYLNNKLVYTATDVPFAYHLDTTNLRNGTYTLKTVSYYNSGRTATTSQKLVVKNPFSFTQFRLFLGEYAAVIIILLVLILLGLVAWLERKRLQQHFNKPSGGAPTAGPTTPTNLQSPPQVFTPTSSTFSDSGSGSGSDFSSSASTVQSIPVQSDEA
jgi:uncharacterized membrane protein YgcG